MSGRNYKPKKIKNMNTPNNANNDKLAFNTFGVAMESIYDAILGKNKENPTYSEDHDCSYEKCTNPIHEQI